LINLKYLKIDVSKLSKQEREKIEKSFRDKFPNIIFVY